MAAPDAAGFSASGFRQGIQLAMLMGMDVATPDGVVFIMAPPVSGSGVDAQGVPWDPAQVGLLPASGQEIFAICALEYSDAPDARTPGADTEPAAVLVTILDEDWEPVSESIAIRLGDRVYQRDRTRPPLGLFSVGIQQIRYRAGDI